MTATDGINPVSKFFFIKVNPVLTVGEIIRNPIIYVNGSFANWIFPTTAFVGGTVTLSGTKADGSPLPSWLTVFPTNYTIQVASHNNNKDPISIKIIATDEADQQVSQTITITTRNLQVNETIIKNDFTINNPNTNLQYLTTARRLPNGNIFVLWEDIQEAEPLSDIYAKIIDPQGNSVSTQFICNKYTANDQVFPSIDIFPNGNIIVAWESYLQDGSAVGVYGRIFSSTGSVVQDEFQINTYTNHEQSGVLPLVLNDGNVLFVWKSYNQDTSKYGAYAKIVNPSTLAEIKEEFRLNDFVTDSQIPLSLTLLQNGNVLILWTSRTQDGDGNGIFGKIISPTGTTIVDEFQVNSYSTDNQVKPSAIVLPNSNILITWESNLQDGSSYGLYGTIITQNRDIVVPEFRINDITTGDQGAIEYLILPNGNIFLAWHSQRLLNGKYAVVGKIIKQNGEVVAPEFLISDWVLGDNVYISLSLLTTGYVFAAWDCLGQDGSDFGIYAKVLDQMGNTVRSEFRVNDYTTSAQENNQLVALNDGSIFVAWSSDQGSGNFDIYGKIYKYAINYVPDILKEVNEQIVLSEKSFIITLPSNMFIDYDNNDYIVTASLADGSPLPSWITFDSVAKTFSGYPSVADEGEYQLKLDITDSFSARSTTMFNLIVAAKSSKPGEPNDTDNSGESASANNMMVLIAVAVGGIVILGVVICLCRRKPKINPAPPREKGDRANQSIYNYPYPQGESMRTARETEPLSGGKVRSSGGAVSAIMIPDKFLCPLSGKLMVEPWTVITYDDAVLPSFEKIAIVDWFKTNSVDPIKGKKKKFMGPNEGLQQEIEDFLVEVKSQQMRMDPDLLEKVGEWIEAKGRINLMKDPRLKVIVERYTKALSN